MISLVSKDSRYSLSAREQYLSQLPRLTDNQVRLQTCNRTELYTGAGEIPVEVTRHLFRVVSGLESPLLGETAIQGQVKNAYKKAKSGLMLSPELHKLFQWALKTGKRVRTETSLSRGAMSHGKAMIEILKQGQVNLQEARILVIGVNNLNSSLVRYITENGNQTVFIANRTYQKALSLARKFGATALRFNKLREQLRETDLLISATSAPHLIVKSDDLDWDQPIIIFDLAVPRDIDPAIGDRPNSRLFNIEDVERKINFNRGNRLNEIAKAEKIIEEEIGCFYAQF